MVEHIVIVQWKEDATEEAIEKAMSELRGLKNKIDSLIDLTCGTNFSKRGKGYTHALVARMADRAGLEAYLEHPEHQRVVNEFLSPIRFDVISLDYEF